MVNSPALFGFANVTDAFLLTGGTPDEFLFWDPVHPSTRGHEVFGREALNRLIDHFSPANGKGNPPARVNSLNGLVTAAKKSRN